MPSLPLPFVVALLLAMLLVRLQRKEGQALRPAVIFVSICTLLTIIVGLRWSIDAPAVRFAQPFVASLIPMAAWRCFGQARDRNDGAGVWLHALPVLVVLLMSATWALWHPPIDLVLALLFFGYGAALLRLGLSGPDGFENARLADASSAYKATLIAGIVLLSVGVVDLAVAGDFAIYGGSHAATIVAVANILTIPVIAYAVATVGDSVPEERPAEDPQGDWSQREPGFDAGSADDDNRIVMAIDRLMKEKRLFRDPDLTLNRLARRAGMPARHISLAVNRNLGKNVSQLVNEYRIAEARRLLTETDMPVTDIMFDAGFQTKSNFNREFLRIVGTSPSAFRQMQRTDLDRQRPILLEVLSPNAP